MQEGFGQQALQQGWYDLALSSPSAIGIEVFSLVQMNPMVHECVAGAAVKTRNERAVHVGLVNRVLP